MFAVTNIVVIAFVALIAYWWGNQGLFSAILHLVCVVVAGALALAIWEPLTIGYLLRGGGFDNFAWGLSLLGLFAVLLLILRVIFDKVVPENVNLPHWADLTFGLPVGALAGILTVGMILIGSGHIQSSHDVGGIRGWQRGDNGKVQEINALWLPAHKLTSDFYSWLSVGSLKTGTPMRRYQPDLYRQATLLRDTYFESHRGSLSMQPGSFEVRRAYYCPELRRFAVELRFKGSAQDYGEQLTVSASQIRLIGSARGFNRPAVSHPDQWAQETSQGSGKFLFEDVTAYLTSVPGRETTTATVQFPNVDQDGARFVQVKNIRVAIPSQVQTVSGAQWQSTVGGVSEEDLSAAPLDDVDFSSATDMTSVIQVSSRTRRITSGVNQMPGDMKEIDKRLVEGDATFPKGGMKANRKLAIQGLYEPEGTRIVQLDVSRNGPADVYDSRLRRKVSDDAAPSLVDDAGRSYSPIGFIHDRSDGTRVLLSPRARVRSLSELPPLPRSGTQELTLVFAVTVGVRIVGFKVDDVMVGSCDVAVSPR